jgi:hypothetical protein
VVSAAAEWRELSLELVTVPPASGTETGGAAVSTKVDATAAAPRSVPPREHPGTLLTRMARRYLAEVSGSSRPNRALLKTLRNP